MTLARIDIGVVIMARCIVLYFMEVQNKVTYRSKFMVWVNSMVPLGL